MIDSMARENDFAALRAIDMIARLRGLAPTTAKRSNGLEAALEEMRMPQPVIDNAEAGPIAEAEPEAEAGQGDALSSAPPDTDTDTVFDPPMPPEARPPVNASPAPHPKPATSPARSRQRDAASEAAREAAREATRAAVRRRLFCYEHLMARHPELSGKIQELSDAEAYFGEDDNLLPPELWPGHVHSPSSIPVTVPETIPGHGG